MKEINNYEWYNYEWYQEYLKKSRAWACRQMSLLAKQMNHGWSKETRQAYQILDALLLRIEASFQRPTNHS
ncbi:MAG: hypothetical protein GF381_00490 [Candidatus Pacebacteria bacterium]|nr:hypothetical protein [Candidatus Paceibacterota bacterium]